MLKLISLLLWRKYIKPLIMYVFPLALDVYQMIESESSQSASSIYFTKI